MSSEMFLDENKPTTVEEQLQSLQRTSTAIKNTIDALQANLQSAKTTAFIVLIVVAISYWMKR